MVPARVPRHDLEGLAALRRGGTVTELLFLYECATREVGQLRAVAEPLGLTVQAISHTFRGLARRGRIELREGRYRPTVAGVAWMHAMLGSLESDLGRRLERLHIIRTTRALAREALAPGQEVVLAIEDGLLTARRGRVGPSRGRVLRSAGPGDLVEVADLEGIVPIRRGKVRVVVLPAERLLTPGLPRALARALRRSPGGLLAAHGLEAFHLVRRASPDHSKMRFGIAPAVEEATRLGIDCTVVSSDTELPRLLDQFEEAHPPKIEFLSLPGGGGGRGDRPRPR